MCSNCIAFYKKKFLAHEWESEEDITLGEKSFFQKKEIVDALNVRFKTFDADMYPLKNPSDIRSERKES